MVNNPLSLFGVAAVIAPSTLANMRENGVRSLEYAAAATRQSSTPIIGPVTWPWNPSGRAWCVRNAGPTCARTGKSGCG